MNKFDRVSLSINHWVEYLLFGLGISMAVIVALQVFFRYALNQSLFWSEELARYLLVWLTFLGATAAYRRKVHPGVDFFYIRLPGPYQKTFKLITYLVSMALFWVMTIYGYQFAHFVRLQISPALNLPKWIILGIIPVCGLIFLIHGMAFIATLLTKKHP